MADIDLDELTLDELKQLQKDVNKAVDTYEVRRKQEARAALEAHAQEMGFTLSDLVDRTAPGKGKSKIPPKYRHPENPSLTWSGRGRQPGWIKEAIQEGTPIDEFRIAPDR